MARLSRRWSLAASHRLHAEGLSEEQNRAVYGKCNNAHGHGHNYVVEVTVAGPIDAETGMVVNLAELDGFARERLLDRFDHQNLNLLPEFAKAVPTTENFALEIERIFREFGRESGLVRLERVHVVETANNSFDVLCGDDGRPGMRER